LGQTALLNMVREDSFSLFYSGLSANDNETTCS
jgi:hypothetical protein